MSTTHDENRKKICALCFGKKPSKKSEKGGKLFRSLIHEHGAPTTMCKFLQEHICEYDPQNLALPTALCHVCYNKLSHAKTKRNSDSTQSFFQTCTSRFEQINSKKCSTTTRSSKCPKSPCDVCVAAVPQSKLINIHQKKTVQVPSADDCHMSDKRSKRRWCTDESKDMDFEIEVKKSKTGRSSKKLKFVCRNKFSAFTMCGFFM